MEAGCEDLRVKFGWGFTGKALKATSVKIFLQTNQNFLPHKIYRYSKKNV